MTETKLSLSEDDYLRFKTLVHRHSGLNFPAQKKQELELGLTKALKTAPDSVIQACQPPNFRAYANFLSQEKSIQAQVEMARLINLLTIGETHFFRNNAHFEALAHTILPELIARKRQDAAAVGPVAAAPPQLRVWSAGCASGEEPYSVAILLRQLIPDIENWRILILATDINQDSLKQAKQASYSEWSFREPQAKAAQSVYFSKQDKRYLLQQSIKDMVTFAPLNLIADSFPAIHNNTISMDLIICRNVTIYFDEETTRTLINKFYQALLNQGWLIVGHSEPALGLYENFETHNFNNAIIYQKPGRAFNSPKPPKPLNLQPIELPPLHKQANGVFYAPQKEEKRLKSALPVKETPKTDDPLAQARRLLEQKEPQQTLEILNKNRDKLPRDKRPAAQCLMARACIETGQWEQARQWAQKAINQNMLLTEGYALLALIDEQDGQIEAAIKNLKRVIYLEPQEPLAHFNLALLYQKNNQLKTAFRSLENAITILQTWPPDKIIPHSGGSNAKRLLEIANMLQNAWQSNFNPAIPAVPININRQ